MKTCLAKIYGMRQVADERKRYGFSDGYLTRLDNVPVCMRGYLPTSIAAIWTRSARAGLHRLCETPWLRININPGNEGFYNAVRLKRYC
jgi:hypothetical protein